MSVREESGGKKSGKLLRAELRHLGPIRMHILSGVKPGEIFMMCPTAAGGGGGGGGGDEVEGTASRGRHAPIEWREEERCCCRPLSLLQRAEGMKGRRGEEAGMMDRRMRGRLCCRPILCGSFYRTYRNGVAARRHTAASSRCSAAHRQSPEVFLITDALQFVHVCQSTTTTCDD